MPYFTIVLLLFFSSSAFAADSAWVTVEGASGMENVTKEDARRRAIEDAERKAVEEVVGVDISSDTLVINFKVSGDIIKAIPYGKVIEKEIIEEGVTEVREKGNPMPSLIYRVKMKAKVVKEVGEPDPYFKINASINRTVFKAGDEMQITVKPTRDCYIYVFNMLEDEKVLTLVPNRFKKDNLIKANDTFMFPGENDRKMGMNLKVHPAEGKKTTKEAVYLLCLKQSLVFDPARFEEGIFGQYSGKGAFITELTQEIVGIPTSERVERFLQYEIRDER